MGANQRTEAMGKLTAFNFSQNGARTLEKDLFYVFAGPRAGLKEHELCGAQGREGMKNRYNQRLEKRRICISKVTFDPVFYNFRPAMRQQ